MRRVKQVTIYGDPAAAAVWQRGAVARAAYLAAPTARMLDLGRIAPGHRVLVVGAGTGDDALDAAGRVGVAGHVVATDVSTAMIAEAKRSVAAAQVDNVKCMVMDAQRLQFKAGTFDAVISRNALMFVPDVAVGLAEIKRVLKAGGRIAFTVWGSGRRNPRLSDPIKAARALGVKSHGTATFQIAVRLGAPLRLTSALREAGFVEVMAERWPVVARYDSVTDAVQVSMDHAGTRELMIMMSGDGAARMSRSLNRRWQKYALPDGVSLPGEQLVAAGTKFA